MHMSAEINEYDQISVSWYDTLTLPSICLNLFQALLQSNHTLHFESLIDMISPKEKSRLWKSNKMLTDKIWTHDVYPCPHANKCESWSERSILKCDPCDFMCGCSLMTAPYGPPYTAKPHGSLLRTTVDQDCRQKQPMPCGWYSIVRLLY